MVLISFIGPPGSGKTTQANLLEACGFKPINTGEILRSIALSGTQMSGEVATCIKKGHFVSPAITARLVSEEIIESKAQHSAISLDGSPRTMKEFEILHAKFVFSTILYLNISDEVSLNRLLIRGRSDDNAQVITERLSLFRIKTLEMLKHIHNGFPTIPLIMIDADQPIHAIHSHVIQVISDLSLYSAIHGTS